jgi:DNA repair protein RadC
MEKVNLTSIAEVRLTYKSKVKPSDRPRITSSEQAFRLFLEYWDDSITHIESMKVMLLNRASRVLGIADLSTGGTNGCLVDVKVVFQYAIKANASSIILAHNHPSGNLKPSQADINITKKLSDAANVLDIQVLDHLILSPEEKYYSIADEGYI